MLENLKGNPADTSNEETVDFSAIVDNDIPYLEKHLADKNLGYMMSLKNFIALTFENVVTKKDGVIKKRAEFLKANDKESAEGCEELLKGLYYVMQSLEEKFNYLKNRIESMNKSGN